MTRIFIPMLVCFCIVSHAQTVERVIISRQDPYNLYVSMDKDSTTLFYEKIVPAKKPVGALVILPGSFESIDDVKKQIS
jgi:hypothetical protein